MVSLPEVQQNGGRIVEEKKDKELTEEELEQVTGGKRLSRARDKRPSAGGGGPGTGVLEPLPDDIRLWPS